MSTKNTGHTLSVIMPNYNDADHIGISLQAICEQSYPPAEVIVVDDGSTDNSIEIIQQMMTKYPAIRLVSNDMNHGVHYTANVGARLTSGDYIYSSSANDLVYPGFFKKCVRMLEKHPQAGMCCADWVIVKDGTVYEESQWLKSPGIEYLAPSQITADVWTPPFPAAANSIFRRKLIPEDEMFRLDLEFYADWFLVQTIAFRHGCCYVPEPLVATTWLEDGYFNRMLADDRNYRRICIKIFQHLALPEYADILPLILRSRSLVQLMKLSARSPYVVIQALQDIKTNQARVLRNQLTIDYVFVEMPSLLYARCKWVVQPLVQLVRNIVIRSGYSVKNLFDRAFAKSFQRYDQARSVIKARLVGSTGKRR